MALSIAVPTVTGAGCVPRALLPSGPALGHSKITCISIVTTCRWDEQFSSMQGAGGCCWTLSGAAPSSGDRGFDFCQLAQSKGHKASGCTGVTAAWSLGENTLDTPLSYLAYPDLPVSSSAAGSGTGRDSARVSSAVPGCAWGRHRSCPGTAGCFSAASHSGQGRFGRCDSPAM